MLNRYKDIKYLGECSIKGKLYSCKEPNGLNAILALKNDVWRILIHH